jgi:hypothetical protein
MMYAPNMSDQDRNLVLAAIQSKNATDKLVKNELFLDGVSFQALRVSPDYEYCPLAIFDGVSAESMNKATANHVFPIGVTSSFVPYDGVVGTPLIFFKHDVVHNSDYVSLPFLKRFLDDPREAGKRRINSTKKELFDIGLRLDSERTLNEGEIQELLAQRQVSSKFIASIKPSVQYENRMCTSAQVHNGYHYLTHEEIILDFSQECSEPEDARIMSSVDVAKRFYQMSAFNRLLPKELQGNSEQFKTDFDTEVKACYIREQIIWMPPIDDIIKLSKTSEITSYLKDSESCLCHAWKSFRHDQDSDRSKQR